MSNIYSSVIEYHCFNDCRQSGCPGHKLQVVVGSMNVVSIVNDDKSEYLFDYNAAKAVLDSLIELFQ